MNAQDKLIYKVCGEADWEEALAKGEFSGASVDLTDGFIHFSTGEQLAETLRRHFAGKSELMLVAVDPGALGPLLRWEPSRGGALFPHLYGALPLSAVRWQKPLSADEKGEFVLPEGL